MWWKLLLLALYVTVLFVLSRILEAVSYYEGGAFLAARLLDPVSLSVRRLKAILDERGVSYTGVLERGELKQLVKTSGEVSGGELEASSLSSLSDDPSTLPSPAPEDADPLAAAGTNFTCGSHFYEEVEDTKDSVWVVQVRGAASAHRTLLAHTDWKAFVKKVSRFGVRTGVFDCALDQSLCDKKAWRGSQLVLALPVGHQAKDHVVLRSYPGAPRPHLVLRWVSANLAQRVTPIPTHDAFRRDWLAFDPDSSNEKVRVIVVSRMETPPMFLSALSVKFTGRVKFGAVDTAAPEGHRILKSLGVDAPIDDVSPTYAVLTPEQTHLFATSESPREQLSFRSLSLLLRTLHPEVNDMFLLSLIVVNAACGLELLVARGGPLRRLGRLLWEVVRWNFLLILLWLPVLAVIRLPYVDRAFDLTLTGLRRLALTSVAGCARADWLRYSAPGGWTFLAATFGLFAGAVAGLRRLLGSVEETADEPEHSSLWSLQSYIGLLQPRGTSRVNGGWSHLGGGGGGGVGGYGVDVELLIERLAVPDLWLRPLVSSQYVHSLPVWKYAGPCGVESDVGSDSEGGPRVESDGEGGGFGPRPLMFVCEACRALQAAGSAARRSEQELEQERIESESACAKFLMDGDYKCQCGQQGSGGGGGEGHGGAEGGGEHGGGAAQVHGETRQHLGGAEQDHGGGLSRSPRGSPQKEARSKAAAAPGGENRSGEEVGQPPGMIAAMECSICLESYRHGAALCGLPCAHSFHQQCIMGWLGRDNHCCPICRWPAYKAKPCTMHQHTD